MAHASVAVSQSAKADPFKATYVSSDGSTWTCSGSHVVNKGQGAFDSETCLITGGTGYVAGTYTGSPVGTLPPFGSVVWNSDSPAEAGAQATSWTITITDNGDGTFTADIRAFYSS